VNYSANYSGVVRRLTANSNNNNRLEFWWNIAVDLLFFLRLFRIKEMYEYCHRFCSLQTLKNNNYDFTYTTMKIICMRALLGKKA